MKRKIISFFSLLLALIMLLCSCAGKYDKIEPTEEDLRVVATVKDCDIYYDELYFSVMNTKVRMAQTYGIDWNNEASAEEHREELYNRVLGGLRFNYAVQLLFGDSGYTLEDKNIQAATQNKIKALIDECGSRKDYVSYLEENCLTDRVLRFNIAVSFASNELIYALNDSGALDEYISFDISKINIDDTSNFSVTDYLAALELLYDGNILLRTEHIYFPNSIENVSDIALSAYWSVFYGEKSISDFVNAESGIVREEFYQVEGERNKIYYDAAMKLDEDDYECIETENGWYLIHRLAPDMSYVNENYFDLIYSYISIKVNEKIEAYANTLELNWTDFGKGLDFTKIK